MKNEPTHLELFQQAQIEALKKRVAELESQLKPEPKNVSIITLDPIYDKPLAEIEKRYINL